MTQKINPTLTLYDSTLERISAEASRRGIDPAELMSEMLTIGAAALAPDAQGGSTAASTGKREPAYYTAAEAAARLRLKARTVSGYCRDGRIKATKVGREWRITPEALQAYTLGAR